MTPCVNLNAEKRMQALNFDYRENAWCKCVRPYCIAYMLFLTSIVHYIRHHFMNQADLMRRLSLADPVDRMICLSRLC